jgi:hypothetical protein
MLCFSKGLVTVTKGLPFVHFYQFHANDVPADENISFKVQTTYQWKMLVYNNNIVLYLLFKPNYKLFSPEGRKLLQLGALRTTIVLTAV